MRMTDVGTADGVDTISFTLWDKDGVLIFSSNWNGVETVEQQIAGGNLSVHGNGAGPV